MGPSLIILAIIVVWVIVLAPLVLGDNKPIRRSGEGYEETRVLHQGGTAPMATRRRPKLTAADVHRHNNSGDEDYEVVDAVAEEERVLIDDAPGSLKSLFTKRAVPAETGSSAVMVIDAEESENAEDAARDTDDAAPAAGGSTAYSVIKAQAGSEENGEDGEASEDAEAGDAEAAYEVPESYLAPTDFGYDTEDTDTADSADAEPAEVSEAEADGADELSEDATQSLDDERTGDTEPSEEDIAFAQARRGRGGWDPQRDARTRADRYQRRQRTFAGLLVASVLSLVAAVMAGGWVWVLPVITIGLTVWFLVALRQLVKKERALRERRMRQLRRARLGVDLAERPARAEDRSVNRPERRRAGSIVLDIDDESPDFDHLPRYRQPAPDHGYDPERGRELPEIGRAS